MTGIKTAIRSVVHKGIETLAEFNRKRLPALGRPHPYLTGIYEPMQRELVIEDLTVAGAIPPELDGRYLRIGPNPIGADPKSYHWFIGDGMVHGVRIARGPRPLVPQPMDPLQGRWQNARGSRSARSAARHLRHRQH